VVGADEAGNPLFVQHLVAIPLPRPFPELFRAIAFKNRSADVFLSPAFDRQPANASSAAAAAQEDRKDLR